MFKASLSSLVIIQVPPEVWKSGQVPSNNLLIEWHTQDKANDPLKQGNQSVWTLFCWEFFLKLTIQNSRYQINKLQ